MQSITSYIAKLLNIVNPVSNRLPIKKPFTYKDKPQHSVTTIQPEMLIIPSGIMPHSGIKKSRFNGQEVTAFEIAKYAITIAQWQTIMGSIPSGNNELSDKHPVLNVSWNDVQRFIKQLNNLTGKSYRLPTELEWEYAVRAERDNISRANTIIVGSFPPTPSDSDEMLGYIWEWVDYIKIEGINPNAALEKSRNILRGGCWASDDSFFTLTSRIEYDKNECGSNNFSFRLAI